MNNIQKLEPLYEGKAKILYRTNDDNLLIQYFKDDVTAFNKEKFDQIKTKGELACEICSKIMSQVKDVIPSHFVERMNEREQLVKAVKIIPLEVIVRNVAAGSFAKNFGIKAGTVLRHPSFELFYKKDELGDPMISPTQVIVLDIATKEEIAKLEELALKLNTFLKGFFAKAGITLVDFKVEFGYDNDGNLILADEISPDTCRLWDTATGKILDKDIFRKNLGDLTEGYTEVYNRIKDL